MEKEYYTVEEAARLLNYEERTIRDWCKQGKLKGAFRVGGARKWQIPRSALQLAPTGVKEEERFKEQQQKEVLDVSLLPSVDLYKDKLTHDRKIFKESDEIMNEIKLDTFLSGLLVGNRFYTIDIDRLLKYLTFFQKESNKYVSSKLRYQCEKCCKIIERLGHFIGIHHDIIDENWKENLGIRYKLVPGGSFDRFYKELTNDSTRARAESRLSNKADRLANECRDAYKEYRATVRENLYL